MKLSQLCLASVTIVSAIRNRKSLGTILEQNSKPVIFRDVLQTKFAFITLIEKSWFYNWLLIAVTIIIPRTIEWVKRFA